MPASPQVFTSLLRRSAVKPCLAAWQNSPMPPEEQRAQQYKKIAKKPASGTRGPVAGKKNKSGDTYFRTCSTIIGSESLTTEFEMDRV
jgi:hypothetical protein